MLYRNTRKPHQEWKELSVIVFIKLATVLLQKLLEVFGSQATASFISLCETLSDI